MSTKKTVAMFAVLCLIALGLGYWYGLPRENSRGSNNGKERGPKHEVLAVENGKKFSISVGDRLSFDFKDGTCNDGYRYILLVSHKEESANFGNSLELIAMLDRYWGPWQEGKTNKIALERNAYGGQA